MDGKVVHLFKQYLLAGQTHTLTLLLKLNSRLEVEARYHDRLSWDCFPEGQLCALWVEHRAHHIHWANLMQSVDFWAWGLMQRLLQITHAQWAYRISTVYLEVKHGWTAAAHKTILETMEDFLHTDPEQLLKDHVTCYSLTLLSLPLVLPKINWSGSQKKTLLWVPHHTWHVGLNMQCWPGTAGATSLVHRRSTSQSWWMKRGVWDGRDVTNSRDCIIASPETVFTSVDKKDKHVCSLLVQNSLLQFNTIFLLGRQDFGHDDPSVARPDPCGIEDRPKSQAPSIYILAAASNHN